MHILLTDILTCPRCGPTFGLILLSDELDDRQVLRGHLGCPNCRLNYAIEGGVADLRYGTSGPPVAPPAGDADADRPYRVAALMGVTTANANLLVLDGAGELPAAVAGILPQAHVIGASTQAPPRDAQEGFISRVLVNGRLPFRNGSMRGVVWGGAFSPDLMPEVARVLMPGARLVIDPAGDQVAEEVRSLGLRLELEQDRVVVAAAPGPG